jgi:hypothetical protein
MATRRVFTREFKVEAKAGSGPRGLGGSFRAGSGSAVSGDLNTV